MFELNVLVLMSLILVVFVVVVLLRSVLLKSKEVDMIKRVMQGTFKKMMVVAHVCPHHLGYLNSSEKGKPIPAECMGCSNIFDCLAHKKKRKK